ncbi:aldehyde dehydrogenase family protein [Dietzia psychralcaliphila]|uniref:aldehyde dehydrogenase family protein n=1 Tax=Dietzia psychralcaliphila TaxID=139021 RepID=UPI001C1E4D4B|nr:aldehyde dehydrogenase family protein [Dietzia psychralcaliphila]
MSIPHYRMIIGGAEIDTDARYELINPATEEVIATAAKGDASHADAAVAEAKRTFESGIWRNLSLAERAEVFEKAADGLERRADEMVRLTTLEDGTTVRLSNVFSVVMPSANLRHFAQMLREYNPESAGDLVGPPFQSGKVRREPLGVCAAITPWNFPVALGAWKILPALGMGNSVVLKTDEKTPITSLILAEILKEAGLPDGVLNVITGDGETVGAQLSAHPDVRKIAFTGSTEVGKKVSEASAGNLKRVTLELGGKGANIVLEDADIRTAVDGSIWAFLMHTGQACESGTRLLLPSSIHDEFVDRMVERLKTIVIGDPSNPATDIGPLISAEQRDRVLRYLDIAKKEGATVAHGGGVPEGEQFSKGFWVEPTVLTDVTNDMTVAREEVFGPVLAVIRYDSVEEAIKIANDTEYGLTAGVWSEDLTAAMSVAEQLESGAVWINDWHMINQVYPFGGFKQSGQGRELGPNAFDAYTQEKAIQVGVEKKLENRAYGLVLSTPSPN